VENKICADIWHLRGLFAIFVNNQHLMSDGILKNGLTMEKAEKARAILKTVGMRAVAHKIGKSETTLHNVLRGESPRIEILSEALEAAAEIQAERQRKIDALPL
jgi:lambda repressor-like predicted transcriptional regulator